MQLLQWSWGGHMGGWMWFGWFGGALAAVLIILVVLRSMRQGGDQRQETPEEELKRRYARGEISEAEYEHRLEELRK